jgi:outer membrane protein OmpA-like peptidoglycan-associated protein
MTEVALRHSSQTLHKLQQLPRWWQGNDGLTSAEAASLAESSAPEPLAASSPSEAAQQELPAADRDRIQADLNRLQQDLASLNTRLQTLETSLGESPTGTLEDRLQRLDQRLDAGDRPDAADPETPAAAPEPTPEPTAETVPLIPYPEPRFPLVSDRIVLPSALLFEPGSSMLTTPGQQLLDSIAPDLRRYGPVTLLVGSHTDSHPDPTLASAKASQLTLQQALAVQQHLAPQIEAEGVRWVILGYGYTRPRTTGITSADQQRNQRIEIGVVPGS